MTQSKFAFKCKNATESEMAQRIAFGFGFVWAVHPTSTNKDVQFSTEKFLTFNQGLIHYVGDESWVNERYDNVATSLEQCMEWFKTPPSDKKIKTDFFTAYKDGDVCINTVGTTSASNFDDFVTKRNEFLGKKTLILTTDNKKRLPFVEFWYRKSVGKSDTKRKVLILDMNDEYLEGLDTEDGNQFKKFSVDKITTDIRVIKFQ